jgi:thiosulfate reductase cytochrome b subunit
MKKRPQPWMIRITHWVNVPVLVIMAGSGLQILAAFPALGPRGEPYRWYPLQNATPPEWLRLGGWLAGARHLHFAFAWLLVINGLVYWSYLLFSGQWRRRYFLPLRDTPNAVQMLAHYLRIRKEAPEQGFYNGLQRFAYSTASLLAVLVVLSGLAIYKPVQLHWLATVFGGYDGARAVHLIVLGLLTLFTVMHIILVSLHPRTVGEMITGGKKMVGETGRE